MSLLAVAASPSAAARPACGVLWCQRCCGRRRMRRLILLPTLLMKYGLFARGGSGEIAKPYATWTGCEIQEASAVRHLSRRDRTRFEFVGAALRRLPPRWPPTCAHTTGVICRTTGGHKGRPYAK